jgi:hypothetical protein
MNVQYAKAPFQDKTLTELYTMICEGLHLKEMELKELEAAARSEPAPITWIRGKKSKNEILEGLFVARVKHLRLLVDEKEDEKVAVSEAVKQDLATLKYSAIVQDIFLAVFMNRTVHLTKDTIDKIKAFVKYCMKILCKWKMAHILRRPVESQEKPNKKRKKNKLELTHRVGRRYFLPIKLGGTCKYQ